MVVPVQKAAEAAHQAELAREQAAAEEAARAQEAAREAAQAAEQARQQAIAAQAPKVVQTTPQPVSATSNEAMLYIFNHESGNDPKRANSEGCLGLGQACPGSKLLAVCPNLDYGCEVNFFTAYANSRYGGWGGAYSWWVNHHWW